MLFKDVLFTEKEIADKLESIRSRIYFTELDVSIATDKLKKANATINSLQNEAFEQKINYLKKKGWKSYIFSARDTQEQKLYSFVEVTFLFKKGVFDKRFSKMEFDCHFGKGFKTSFSEASFSLKGETFIEFERWLRKLNNDDYIIVKDIWF